MDMNLGEILFNPAQVPSGHLWPDGDTRLPDAAPGPASSPRTPHLIPEQMLRTTQESGKPLTCPW